jgi:hypothetical protein
MSVAPWVLAVSLVLLIALVLTMAAAGPARAADPTPLLIDPLDPRAGAGANRIGAPLLAALIVVGLGAAAAAATALYVRLIRRR